MKRKEAAEIRFCSFSIRKCQNSQVMASIWEADKRLRGSGCHLDWASCGISSRDTLAWYLGCITSPPLAIPMQLPKAREHSVEHQQNH